MKMKQILITFIGGAGLLTIIGCDSAFKFEQVEVSCQPPASSARFGKNVGPVIVSPAVDEPFNTTMLIKGTCAEGYPIEISGRGLSESAVIECQQGEFAHSVKFNTGDGTKEIDVAQKTFNGENITDRRCFSQDTVPPKVVITASSGEQSLNTKTLNLSGVCESGLDVEISGPHIVHTVTTKCNSGHFQTPITFIGEDGLKNVVARQIDRAGNRGDDNRNYRTDTVAPRVLIISPTAMSVSTGTVTLTGECENEIPVILQGALSKNVMNLTCSNGQFSAEVNLSNVDGIKNIIASQTDLAGNRGSDNRNFQKDATAPVVQITAPAAGLVASSKIVLKGKCESGLPVNYSGDGLSLPTTSTCTNNEFSTELNLAVLNGNNGIVVSQTDAAGNTGQDKRTFIHDALAPAVKITAPASGTTAIAGLTVSGTCEVDLPVVIWGPGVNKSTSTNCMSGASGGAGGTFTSAIIFSNEQGNKEVRASQTDAAGNNSTDTRVFVRDSIAPIVKITSPSENSYVDASAIIMGTCESGLDVIISGAVLMSPVTTNCDANTFTVSVNLSAGDSQKQIAATQTDVAGNIGTHSRTFIRDSNGPVIKILSPDATSVFHSVLTLKGICESGLAVTIDGSGTSATTSTACSSGTFSTNITLSNGDGLKIVNVSQTDGAGHIGSDSREFLRDSTPPDVKITNPLPGVVPDVNITITGTCENGLNVILSGSGLNATTEMMCTENKFLFSVKLKSINGNNLVTVTQTDATKNIGSDSKTYTVDSTGPEVIITGPPTGTRSATGLTLTGTCQSGLIVTITGDVNAASTTACTNNKFSTDILFSEMAGSKKVTASQTDAKNKTGSDTRNFVRAHNAGYETYSSRGPGGKVDILFVDDNSTSMEVEQAALGDRFSSFTTQLENVDWQAGIITTDCTNGSPYNFCGQLFDFELLNAGEYILNVLTPNFLDVFKKTIQREETADCWKPSSTHPCPASNEEGLKSTIESFKKRNTDNAGFFRNESDLAIVYLSDENEQSTGPNGATTPAEVINAFKSTWGTTKKLSAYAIIIKPGDRACLDIQQQQPAGRLNSNYGTYQYQLAEMTGGLSVSICEPDYSVTLQRIGQDVTRLSKSYDLPQTPIVGSVKVAFNGVTQSSAIYVVNGNRVTFNDVPALGTKVEIFYEF